MGCRTKKTGPVRAERQHLVHAQTSGQYCGRYKSDEEFFVSLEGLVFVFELSAVVSIVAVTIIHIIVGTVALTAFLAIVVTVFIAIIVAVIVAMLGMLSSWRSTSLSSFIHLSRRTSPFTPTVLKIQFGAKVQNALIVRHCELLLVTNRVEEEAQQEVVSGAHENAARIKKGSSAATSSCPLVESSDGDVL